MWAEEQCELMEGPSKGGLAGSPLGVLQASLVWERKEFISANLH